MFGVSRAPTIHAPTHDRIVTAAATPAAVGQFFLPMRTHVRNDGAAGSRIVRVTVSRSTDRILVERWTNRVGFGCFLSLLAALGALLLRDGDGWCMVMGEQFFDARVRNMLTGG